MNILENCDILTDVRLLAMASNEKSKSTSVKCLSDGELSMGRKVKACGLYFASRFIRQKADQFLLYPLLYAVEERRIFLWKNKKVPEREE